jgi:hypothetical protein
MPESTCGRPNKVNKQISKLNWIMGTGRQTRVRRTQFYYKNYDFLFVICTPLVHVLVVFCECLL